jgi:hypothetical protein
MCRHAGMRVVFKRSGNMEKIQKSDVTRCSVLEMSIPLLFTNSHWTDFCGLFEGLHVEGIDRGRYQHMASGRLIKVTSNHMSAEILLLFNVPEYKTQLIKRRRHTQNVLSRQED